MPSKRCERLIDTAVPNPSLDPAPVGCWMLCDQSVQFRFSPRSVVHMTTLRWLFVLPGFAFGLLVAFVLSALLVMCVDSMCLSRADIQTTLVPWWCSVFNHAAVSVGCFVGSSVAILLPVALAPRYKNETANLAFLFGAISFGFLFAQFEAMFPAYIAALLSAFFSVVLVRWRFPNAT